MNKRTIKNAVIVFQTKMDAGGKIDSEIRLMIKTLRGVLLERQQRRAAVKCQQAHPSPAQEPSSVTIDGWTVPGWMLALDDEAKSAVLAGYDDRCPLALVREFEAGRAPHDEPPGLEERAYLLWRACGGGAAPPKPVTPDDL